MDAAFPPLLPLTTLQRAYECVSRGICEPLDTLVQGWVYNLDDVCRRHHDIFVVLSQNYPKRYTVIKLPQRCHEKLKQFLEVIDTYHVDRVNFSFSGHTSPGRPVILVDGGGFTQALSDWENPQPCMCLLFLYFFISDKTWRGSAYVATCAI